ncbi:sensor domain-containing diguanylate cyclase [Novosphingobium sp. 9]|uniref:GGDEF domain-containing protein n=1 Tax=Novosphingobium sp. 9 TaxID=2025349 RepID=UPI0021B556A7|nr:GGDEF domain-containing protein [Novosphingobium sp. 9]
MNLGLLYAGLFASLSLLCLCVFLSIRGQRAIAWLAGALLCAALETCTLVFSHGTGFEQIGGICALPAAYLCFAQAVRLATGGADWDRKLAGVVAGLTAMTLALQGSAVPFVVQAIPFQVGCALALFDAGARLWRRPDRHLSDAILSVIVASLAAIFITRIVLFPFIFPHGADYFAVKSAKVERMLMLLVGTLTPPCVFLLLARIIGGQLSEYRRRAERDGLTGLYNRETFERLAAARRGTAGCIVICDIDRFKAVNDRFGHLAGDGVIRSFATLLAAGTMPAARIGGEEFALLLPGVPLAEARAICDRLRMDFAQSNHSELPGDQRVTASFGLAAYAGAEPLDIAWRQADSALYRAKRFGRNRVCLAGEAPIPHSAALYTADGSGAA